MKPVQLLSMQCTTHLTSPLWHPMLAYPSGLRSNHVWSGRTSGSGHPMTGITIRETALIGTFVNRRRISRTTEERDQFMNR